MKVFLFPGQGAQYSGMGKDFAKAFSRARETFQEADDILGEHLSHIIFEGPADLLTETCNSQLAIFVNSMAIFRVIEQQLPHLVPDIAAGLSLGEYTALCVTKRLGFKETLLLVQERGKLMNQACERVRGTMSAVLGLSADAVEEGVRGIEGVWVANYNCPGQIVISGTEEGVTAATHALKAKGAKRVLPLSVHGAFHSGLMQSAQDDLAPHIARAPLQESDTTIDRSRFKATIVRRGSKIDNLCQIAHNVEIGEDNAIAAQTGLAGSSKTGKHVLLGGQVGIVGHVILGDHVLIATRGGVSKSLKAGKYRGSPAIPIEDYNRQEGHVRKLKDYAKRLKQLEEKIQAANTTA